MPQSTAVNSQARYPEAVITNGQIRARIYLPDPARGFYRSTRFDWSGVIASLEYRGREFYGPWFTRTDPPVRDFVYEGAEIVAGAQSAVTGPAEEFQPPQGFASAKPGETFVKIGVGLLRRPSEATYSGFANYELVDIGTRSATSGADNVSFTQEVNDPASGYGYQYRKTVRLTAGRPGMVIEHSLTNIGRLPIQATQYNHNFLTLDGTATGSDYVIRVPFEIQTPNRPDPALAEIRGREIHYARVLVDRDRVTFPIQGFGADSRDYDVTVENRSTGAGFRVTSDRPLSRLMLWSIRSVISMEPFVDVSTQPGATTTWRYTYTYFAR
jgi:hypothetical protein